MTLSNKQKKHLKRLAHGLKPVVLLGQNGLTQGVLAEIEIALEHHELTKVKIATDDSEMAQQIIDTIIRETKAITVNKIGHMLVLFRQTEQNKIDLPPK